MSLISKQSLPAGQCSADFFGEGFLAKSIITRRFADTLSRREKRSIEVPTCSGLLPPGNYIGENCKVSL